VSDPQFGSDSQPSGIDMSDLGTSSVNSPDGWLKRSASGRASMRDASPGCDIRAASPDWARAGNGAVGREEGPAVHDDCAPGCVDAVVIDTVNGGHFSGAISSLRLRIISSQHLILARSLVSVDWDILRAARRLAASSASGL
jgi:hypothetical protein